MLAKIFRHLLDDRRARPREHEKIFWPFARGWKDNEVFRKKSRLARNHRAIEIDGLGKAAAAFARDENDLARFFIGRDKRAE